MSDVNKKKQKKRKRKEGMICLLFENKKHLDVGECFWVLLNAQCHGNEKHVP